MRRKNINPFQYAMFVLILLTLGGSSLVQSQVTDPPDINASWVINGHGVGAIKYNQYSGDSWILEARAGQYYWVWIEADVTTQHGEHAKNQPVIRLLRDLTDKLTVETDATGLALGLLIGQDYVDAGFGLKPGDSIRSVNKQKITDVASLFDALKNAGLQTDVVLGVLRDSKDIEIKIPSQD